MFKTLDLLINNAGYEEELIKGKNHKVIKHLKSQKIQVDSVKIKTSVAQQPCL